MAKTPVKKMRFVERPSPKTFTSNTAVDLDNLPGAEIDALIRKTITDGAYGSVTMSLTISLTGQPKEETADDEA